MTKITIEDLTRHHADYTNQCHYLYLAETLFTRMTEKSKEELLHTLDVLNRNASPTGNQDEDENSTGWLRERQTEGEKHYGHFIDKLFQEMPAWWMKRERPT